MLGAQKRRRVSRRETHVRRVQVWTDPPLLRKAADLGPASLCPSSPGPTTPREEGQAVPTSESRSQEPQQRDSSPLAPALTALCLVVLAHLPGDAPQDGAVGSPL